jgi:deoxynucleoside triphosphate triphosphohydrolase SAMHD1
MRVVHDSIHGTYHLHDLLWVIIDSPEFQRLRKIKQTGNTYRVYPGAVHTRFEHSLGTAYLCRSLCEKLKLDNYILCLQIAALCHDIGHCAFSHLFDDMIVKKISKSSISHEGQSYLILKRIILRNKALFSKYNINLPEIQLIGKLIIGSEKKTPLSLKKELNWSIQIKERYLFEIISNESNGIDVDKFDYIKRDCYHIGITCGFDSQRLMEFAYLKTYPNGNIHIEYYMKAKEIIKEMWRARTDLHSRAYRHRVVQILDEMIATIFYLVCDYYPVVLLDGSTSTIKNATSDLNCYLSLNDNTYDKIYDYCLQNRDNPDLNRAAQIITDIEKRNLWKVISKVTNNKQIDFSLNKQEQGVIVSMSVIDNEYIYYFIITDMYKGDIGLSISNIKKKCEVR